MKNALTYLTFTRLKNQVKILFTTPTRLIYLIFMVVLLGFVLFNSQPNDSQNMAVSRDPMEWYAIVNVFITIMFLLIFSNAYNNGATMFTLSDVNLIFPAPIHPHKALFYGLFRQLGSSFFLGFFIPFQYGWANSIFGVTLPALLLVMLIYALVVFSAQFLAMTLYSNTSDKPRAQSIISKLIYVLVAIFILPALYFALPAIKAGDFPAAITAAAKYYSSIPAYAMPISGWVSGIYAGILQGKAIQVVIFALIFVGALALTVVFMVKSKINFYEDVIQSAETAQSAIKAQKEGAIGESVGKNVRIGKIGLSRGVGASAIFYKHLLETRRSGVFIISQINLIFMAIIIISALFLKDSAPSIVQIFFISVYLRIFTVSLSRFGRELSKPYIYLIPEPPVLKMIYAIGESLLGGIIESILLFGVVGVIMNAAIAEIVACIIGQISFTLLVLAGNIATDRILGNVRTKGIVIFLFMLILLLMSIPGAVGAILVVIIGDFALFGISATALIVYSIITVPISILTLYLCRNLLQYTDFN